MILRVATLMAVCLVLHYFLSLAWPLCSLLIGTILTLVWLVRACVRCCGRVAFYTQRLAGGVRDGHVVIVKVTENAAIKSSGMYLSFDPEATRGDPPLLLALKGYERVHLCRHDSCPEDGQHFKSYVLARQLNPEKFHLMSTAAGAQRSGSRLMGWFFSKADQTAKKLKDYASESEREEAAVVEPEKEKRQGVTKVFAAGLLMSQTERAPGLEDVERLSQEFFRLEQARLAVEAEGVMGHPEAKVAPVEHELRMYAHDILKPHHDKDYRAAVSPLAALEEIRIIVVRADYKGDLLLETVVGSQWTHHDVWVMISKGHMTLLQPPSKTIGEALARKEVYHTPCLGFRYFWHQRHDQAKRPGNHCAQTLQDQERRRQGGSRHVWMFEENRLLASPVSVYGRGGARRQFMEREGTPAWC